MSGIWKLLFCKNYDSTKRWRVARPADDSIVLQDGSRPSEGVPTGLHEQLAGRSSHRGRLYGLSRLPVFVCERKRAVRQKSPSSRGERDHYTGRSFWV